MSVSGYTPFVAQTPPAIYQRVLHENIVRRIYEICQSISSLIFSIKISCVFLCALTAAQTFESDIPHEAQDLVLQLCAKDPLQRLCCSPERSVDDLRKHAFFKDFDWTLLFCRRMPSPFRGMVSKPFQAMNQRSAANAQRNLDSFVSDTLTQEQQVNCLALCCFCSL